MVKLLSHSLKRTIIYAGLVLACSIPVYYLGISMLWKYEMKEHDVILTPAAGREDSFLIIGAVTILTISFFALLLGGLILLNRRISRQMWQPFYRSLDKIRNFDLNQRGHISFEKTGITEFTELNQSLQKLIDANISVYNQQKEFADNASHELQTPLAIVQSKLELLSQNSSLTDEQYHIIEDALAALARAGRINKNLLLLTKIENSQFMEKEKIDLSVLLRQCASLFAPFSEEKRLEWKIDIYPGVEIEGNKTLVEILLNNLMTNAIRHSPQNGKVNLHLSPDQLVVSNEGSNSLRTDQLFKRFASASTGSAGTGLGLALVKQICNRYNWKITYMFENNYHVFTVHF